MQRYDLSVLHRCNTVKTFLGTSPRPAHHHPHNQHKAQQHGQGHDERRHNLADETKRDGQDQQQSQAAAQSLQHLRASCLADLTVLLPERLTRLPGRLCQPFCRLKRPQLPDKVTPLLTGQVATPLDPEREPESAPDQQQQVVEHDRTHADHQLIPAISAHATPVK